MNDETYEALKNCLQFIADNMPEEDTENIGESFDQVMTWVEETAKEHN